MLSDSFRCIPSAFFSPDPSVRLPRLGSIRLLRCSWLVGASAGDHFKRMQELPPEAFAAPKEAEAALRRGDRSVRWSLVDDDC